MKRPARSASRHPYSLVSVAFCMGSKPAACAALALLVAAALAQGATTENLRRRDIQGGTPVSVYDRPFAVLLVVNVTPTRTCTGALVADEWVLTAAHCVDGVAVGEHSWESDLIVAHGYPDLTEVRHAVRTIMHEDYDPLERYEDWEHDIALLRLSEPFLSRTAVAVDLADPEDSIFLHPGTMSAAVGWGGENADSMTEASWPLAACPVGAAGHLCTNRGEDTALQQGDSGGPLLWEGPDGWEQIGVHSSISDDGVHRHVRVAEHLEWIAAAMDSEPELDACPVEPDTPGPPSAPPSFVPQAVEIALGTSGDTLTLMTAEDGGYTLNARPVSSGTVVSASNGSAYTLVLDGSTWSAVYRKPAPIWLALGTTGGTISIERLEDGSYQSDGRAISNGTVVTAENGNMYTIRIDASGVFRAEYRRPSAIPVHLGLSGTVVEVSRNEDGSFSARIGDQWVVLAEATRITAENGDVYRPVFSASGRWTGFEPAP